MAIPIHSDHDYLGVSKPINLPAPTASGDAANKAYVDAAIEGIAWKDSARVATSSNINLASPGATLDGITMATSDRFLARGQTTAADNGIYVWNGAATPATRAADASTAAELEQAVVTIEEGTDAGTSWRQTAVNFTLGSGSVAFTSFGTGSPSASETTAGIMEIATLAEVDAGSDDARAVTALKLATHANRKLKSSTDVGDGSATQYTITHNFNTRDVSVQVRRNSGNYENIVCEIDRTSVNAVRLTFATAPTSNQYRCLILG